MGAIYRFEGENYRLRTGGADSFFSLFNTLGIFTPMTMTTYSLYLSFELCPGNLQYHKDH